MRLLSFFLVTFLLILPVSAVAEKADPIWNFEASDPAMNAAIAEARETLPILFDKISQSDPSQEVFGIKVAFVTPDNGHEHIWVAYVGREDDDFQGVLMNEPALIDKNRGDNVRFTNADISDWFFWEDEKMHGAFTIRVMLPQLPEDAQAYYKDVLAPKPTQ